jgi:single-strand DNA-binding protein
MNKVIIAGRLMREPELRKLPSGKESARLVLVYSRKYQNKKNEWKEELHFFEVDVYSPGLIERVRKLGKGDKIVIEGELRQNKWESLSGEKRSKVRIKANRIQLISKPKTATIKKQTITHS